MPRMLAINKLWTLLDQYTDEVNATQLADSSKRNYLLFAEQFVRWIDNDFTPGVGVARDLQSDVEAKQPEPE